MWLNLLLYFKFLGTTLNINFILEWAWFWGVVNNTALHLFSWNNPEHYFPHLLDVTSCESHGSTFVAVEESSAQAATHSSLVVNKWSADTVSKSSLDEEESAASKSSTKPTKRMVSVPSETFESVHSGTAPRSFVHTQG